VTIGSVRLRHAGLVVPSVLSWIMLSGSAIPGLPDFCGPGHSETALLAGMGTAWRLNPIGPLLLSWLLMLCAMMLPLLGAPIAQVGTLCGSRFRRALAVIAFLSSYAAVWLGVLLLLAAATTGLRLATTMAPLIALGVAAAWQATPIKARCLVRCRAPAMARPGLAPEVQGLCHGVVTARNCAGSGWALMALPFLFETGHFPMMVLAALIMIWDRCRPVTRGRGAFRRRVALG